jgi:hypothetical protein
MNSQEFLEGVRIASPCPASWTEMAGDERVRFCKICSKHVYNLSAMTAQDAASLVVATEGRMCARFYRRADGTILTADCPVGLAAALRKRLRRLAGAAALGLAGFLPGSYLLAKNSSSSDAAETTAPEIRLQQWADQILTALGLRSRPSPPSRAMVMGAIMHVGPKPTSPGSLPPPPACQTSSPRGPTIDESQAPGAD